MDRWVKIAWIGAKYRKGFKIPWAEGSKYHG
jgi:hypothetical protein